MLPASGDAAAYPSDSYVSQLTLWVGVPGTKAVDMQRCVHCLPTDCSQPYGAPKAPGQRLVDYAVELGSTRYDFHLACAMTGDGLNYATEFTIILSRGSERQLFTYLVCLIPYLFGALFLHMFFALRKPLDSGVLVALIAAVLAILPVRLVLVPGGIPTPSIVDVVLAGGAAFLVLVTGAGYLLDLERPSQKASEKTSGRFDDDPDDDLKAPPDPGSA